MVGHFGKYDSISKYRLDRITNLEILEDERLPQPEGFSVTEFFEKEFSMFAGEHVTVELLCENKLMGSLIDKFGTDFQVEPVDEDYFKAIVEVALSENFFGWVLASKGAMKIVSPKSAVVEFNKIIELYK